MNLTLSQTKPCFWCLAYMSFENFAEKEKLLITRNVSFSLSVFYPFGELSAIFIKSEIVVCKLFQFGSLKFLIWEGVNSLPNNKVLGWSKLEAFADDKINVT